MNNNLKFIKVIKNNKGPISSINNIKNLHAFNEIDIKKYNVGIPAKPNNLIILDVDVKNDGLKQWREYIKEHGEPMTVAETTPGGGFHYYFLKDDATNTEQNKILISQLKCKSGYRGAGIDIRINGGYTVSEPSTIDNKEYKFFRHYSDNAFLKIPDSLLKWLLEFEKINPSEISNHITFNNTKEYKAVLDSFGDVDSKKWHDITKATKNIIHNYHTLKEHKIKKIWNEWSKTQDGYDEEKNEKLWNFYNNTTMNFNILMNKNKDEPPKFLNSVKPYKELHKIQNIKTIDMNNNYIYDEKYEGDQLTKDHFINYDTIIIKSTTGTGKTSNTAKLINITGLNQETKIISIVNRIVMVEQHKKNFEKEKIFFSSYQNKNTNYDDDNVIICLDSILKYSNYTNEFFNNYIIYIDEISSLITSLTHNDNLNNKLRLVYLTLMKIINNCKKIIVSDATINDNVFEILKNRKDDKKIFIINSFKKYKGIEVVIYNDESKFINEMNEHIKNNNPFLCGSDSMSNTKILHQNALNMTDEKNTIIKTSTNNFNIKDACEQFKNKFVFYSPSITTALDISYDTPQSVFIHIEGNTINPLDSFQQATRTRNIKKLFVYVNEKISNPKYKDIEDTKQHFKDIIEIYKYNEKFSLGAVCFNIVDDEFKFNENSFFNLFIYNEYLNDVFQTNKKAHLINILNNNGFKVFVKGAENKRMTKTKKDNIKNILTEKDEKKFLDHVEAVKIDDILKKNFEFLNIHDKDKATKYKALLLDVHLKDKYLNLIKLLKKPETIKNKLSKLGTNLTKYKIIYTNYNKVFLLSQLEEALNIKRFQLEKKIIDEPIKIDNTLIKTINTAFKVDKNAKTPETFNKFIEYYTDKLNNLIKGLDIITAQRIQKNKKRETEYTINEKELNYYLELYEMSDPSRIHLSDCKYFYKQNNEIKKPVFESDFLDVIEEYTEPDPTGLDYGI